MNKPVRKLLMSAATDVPHLPAQWRRELLRSGNVLVGPNTEIRSGTRFRGSTGARVVIGAGSFVNFGCTFDATAPITLGDGVDIAFNVDLITATHEFGTKARRAGEQRSYPIVISSGTWVGASARILPGITIGPGCIIAAGSVVTSDCAPHGLYAGVPARRIRELEPLAASSAALPVDSWQAANPV